MNKKRLSVIVGVTVISVSVIGGTLAWFTDNKNVTNKISTGAIKHEIVEKFDESTSQNLLPGEEINKDVWIHNIEKSDSLLRVKITPEWVDANGTKVEDASTEEIKLNIKDSKWTKGDDGFYYYNEVFKAHDKTATHIEEADISEESILPSCYSEQILDSLELSSNVSSEEGKYDGRRLDVKVESQTVQVNKDAYAATWDITGGSTKTLLDNIIDNYKNN